MLLCFCWTGIYLFDDCFFPCLNHGGCRSLSQVTSPLQPHTHAYPSRAQRKAGSIESDPASALQEKEQFWWCIWCWGYLASFTHILGLINPTLINPQVFREEDSIAGKRRVACFNAMIFKIILFIITHNKSKLQPWELWHLDVIEVDRGL